MLLLIDILFMFDMNSKVHPGGIGGKFYSLLLLFIETFLFNYVVILG